MSAPGSPPEPPRLAYELPEPVPLELRVLEVRPATPTVTTVRAAVHKREGDGPISHAPGQDVTVTLPGAGAGPVRRRYTIAAYDPLSEVLELEVVAHGDGPGARWLASAVPGSLVEAIGPRGKITVVAGVSTHVFVGDEASFAAVAAMAGAVPAGGRVVVLADVADASERRPLAARPGVALDLRWLERDGAPAEAPGRVEAALAGLELDESSSHAYVLGEFHVVAAARAQLVERLGSANVSSKPYWRAGRPNAERGEPDREP